MFGLKKNRFNFGRVNTDTNNTIEEALEKQQEIKKSWSKRRPTTLAVSNPKPVETEKVEPIAILPKKPSSIFNDDSKKGILGAYWFPLLCLAAVLSVALWTFWPEKKTGVKPAVVPEPVVRTVDQPKTGPNCDIEQKQAAEPEKKADIQTGLPIFDIVRVESNGSVVIAGRGKANENVSISINGKIVATVMTNENGEFAFAPKNKFRPGNYTIRLLSSGAESARVFLYVDEKAEQSLSLLMTDKESRVLQAPASVSAGSFAVSKVDYIANKRLVVQGKGLPRLRVTMSLNGNMLGMTRVSDHKNFGLGAGVGELKPGEKYSLSVKMHDTADNVVGEFNHEFIMPKITPADDTFYVVRRGDTLWVISRNFLGKGIQFSLIASANDIQNPDLIYPKQKFKIPVKAK